MVRQTRLPADPESWLVREAPDAPVLFFRPDVLQATARRFLAGFPGLVTYAVKANPDPAVLANLAAAGIGAFDVASPEEMALARAAAPDAVLHYHNPVRSAAEIAAGRAAGVASWSVDRLSELDKLACLAPRTEIAVRLKLPVPGAAYDFGSKFGAAPEEAAALLRAVVARGFTPSVTFHPGTQCTDPAAWARYIAASAEAATAAGVRLARLNVGGGFAADRSGAAPDLEAVFAVIGAATREAFGANAPALVCEPGRAMVAEAVTLALRVKASDDRAVTLNDGIYGALAEWRDMGPGGRLRVLSPAGHLRSAAPRPRLAFGPTCDSLDRLPDPIDLPGDIAEGDWLICPAMGAYSGALVTRFNGYGAREVVTLGPAAA
ncbi:alanine racemase [Roseivivax isoporae]|uniref:ornithine decarboxylase n=1 Tax=Roseivivax isoporae LMG 25204 TaxID=1449351 RepID=X7F3M7_9RHOB|nr:alanine racemase [Roseivivax isoporae]ETX27410.1 ornithine decarboxylase [Roseivivax isoporae LMG 25204]